MFFLPFENITYHTKLPTSEVIKRLNRKLSSQNFFLAELLVDRKAYKGNIYQNSFKINKKDKTINLFTPTIKGKCWEDSNGTTIEIKIRLSLLVIIFTIVWIGSILFQLGITAINSSETFDVPFLIIPFLVIIFGYVLTTVMFKYESTDTKKYLAELFEAEIKSS